MKLHKNITPLIIILLGLSAMIISSCGSTWNIEGRPIIAYVNGEPIYYATYDSVMKEKHIMSTTPEKDKEIKKSILDEMIENELISQQVDSIYNDLKSNPEFQKKRDDYLSKSVLKLMYQKEIADNVFVSDNDAKKYYDENINRYTNPEQVRASHILIKVDIDSTEAANNPKKLKIAERKAKKLADKIYKKAINGADFAELAKKYSDDPGSAARGGDLGFFTRGRMVKEFEDVAFSMKVGEISKPIKSKFGYHIIKVTDRKSKEVKPFDDARLEQIKQTEKARLEREMAQSYVDSIKNAAKFVFNTDILANDEDTTYKGSEWVATVNDVDTILFSTYKEQKPKYMRFKGLDSLSMDDKEDMIKTLSLNDLLVQIARKKGYFNDSTVVAQGDQYTRSQAKLRVDDLRTAKDFSPSDSALQAYFNEHIDEFIVDKPLHVYHIIFTDSAMAKAVYDSIEAGADFVEMAKRYYPGEPEIREVAYDLDFISEREMPKAFWDAANSLKVGEVSPPVRTEWGWHIIKLVSRKHSKTFEQVKNRIKTKLRKEADQKANDEYIAKLKKNAKIKINNKLLDEYVITYKAEQPKLVPVKQ